jgi:hypothetical protein
MSSLLSLATTGFINAAAAPFRAPDGADDRYPNEQNEQRIAHG